MINDKTRKEIANMVARAKARPIPLETLMQFAIDTRQTNVLAFEYRPDVSERPPSECIMLGDISVNFSVEEQPAGFVNHLSLMVGDGTRFVSWPIVAELIEEFGMHWPADDAWVEEVSPGAYAVSLIQLYQPRKEGHA